MKALNILYSYRKLLLNETMIEPEELDEVIKALEDIHSTIDNCIEEIGYAIAKPMYSDVYLNNTIRFLKVIKDLK